MLATDLGQIVGNVALDLAGDDTAFGVSPVGLTVELWSDNGDGVFNTATDTLDPTTATTTAGGAYRFDNLTAGSYFTRVNLTGANPDGRLTRETGATTNSVSDLITISAADAMGSLNLTVDNFSTPQSVTASTAGATTSSDADGANPGDAGVRDLFVNITGGAGEVTLTSNFVATNVLNLGNTGSATGVARVVWDGTDGTATAINTSGLSLDLLDGGTNDALTVVASADKATTLTIRLYSGAGNVSTATIPVQDIGDAAIDGDANEEISIPLDTTNFVTTSGGGADLSNVGAIELEVDFSAESLDAQFGLIGVQGFTTFTEPLAVFPSLSLGNQVWREETTDDSMFMTGDTALDGVALTLYEDTDGDGQYTDEAALANTTTAGGGLYQFTGLLPSDYIVQVDAMNFTTGLLVAHTTSTANDAMGMAPDVDDAPFDDSKDRGTAAGDGSVVSKPVTLVGGAEPDTAVDGDGTDGNQLVDFAFLAPEVTVTKSVDQAQAAIGETLVYTMVVSNIGLTDATNVQLTDTLPAGVQFQSGTTTVGGQTVSGSAGSQTATSAIGTLAPGAMATVTINALILPTATGTLTNTVNITGTGDVNLANNSATDATTIAPTVDLTIDKETVTAGPLEVGDVVTFEVTATNNGPSNATNVRVIDELPTGLTYLDNLAGPTPTVAAIAGGTQLTYNLGALNNGAQQVIRFRATVATDTQPSFTNQARVELLSTGTETETDSTNNADTSPISIQRQPISKRAFLSTSIA